MCHLLRFNWVTVLFLLHCLLYTGCGVSPNIDLNWLKPLHRYITCRETGSGGEYKQVIMRGYRHQI